MYTISHGESYGVYNSILIQSFKDLLQSMHTAGMERSLIIATFSPLAVSQISFSVSRLIKNHCAPQIITMARWKGGQGTTALDRCETKEVWQRHAASWGRARKATSAEMLFSTPSFSTWKKTPVFQGISSSERRIMNKRTDSAGWDQGSLFLLHVPKISFQDVYHNMTWMQQSIIICSSAIPTQSGTSLRRKS